MRWIREHKLIASLISLLVVLALIFVLSVVTGVGDNSFAAFVNNGVTKVSGFFFVCGKQRQRRSGRYLFRGKQTG